MASSYIKQAQLEMAKRELARRQAAKPPSIGSTLESVGTGTYAPAPTTGGLWNVPVVGQLARMGTGVGSVVGQAGTGLASLALSGVGGIAGVMGNKQGQQFYNQAAKTATNIGSALFQKPQQAQLNTISGAVGQGIGEAALVAAPTKGVAAAKGITEGIGKTVGENIGGLPGVGKPLSYITQKILNAIPEAAVGFGLGKVQGEKTSDAAIQSAFFGAGSALGEIVGDTWNAVKGSLGDNVGRAIGLTGKASATQALNRIPQATRALSLMSKIAPDIKVFDNAGVEKVFDPVKATFAETLQAWTKTRDSVYQAYTELAKQSGDKGAMFTNADFDSIISTLQKDTKDKTGAFKSKADSLIGDIERNFGTKNPRTGEITYSDTDLSRIQKFLESVNTDVNPLSDKAAAEMSGTLSRAIRGIMDDKITSTTGGAYQSLRNSYSDLKSIENDLVNQFKKSARGVGGAIGKYIEGFGTIDIVASMISKNPVVMARGVGDIILAQVMKNLRDPEIALQRAFGMMKQETPSAGSVRAFGVPDVPKTPAVSELPKKATPPTKIEPTKTNPLSGEPSVFVDKNTEWGKAGFSGQ